MTRILTLLLALTISISGITQTTTAKANEERETKLREAIGTASAGLIYNTYLALGAISDNYVSKGYTEEKVNTLFAEQRPFLTHIESELSKLITDKSVSEASDITYLRDISLILKGFLKQMEYFQSYLKDKSPARITTYDNQRKKNWDKIALVMGID